MVRHSEQSLAMLLITLLLGQALAVVRKGAVNDNALDHSAIGPCP